MVPEEQGTLPSWIPLLKKSEFGVPEEAYTGRKNGDNLVGPAGSPTYEACGKKQYDPVFETLGPALNPLEAEILVARGLKLARINKRSPRNTGGVILRESLNMIGWEGFRKDSNSVPSEVWRTPVADRDLEGRIAPSWYQRACLRCLEIAHMFSNGDLNVGEILQGHSDMLLKYLKRVQNVTWNRRFFTARGGDFLITRDDDQDGVQSSSHHSDTSLKDSHEMEGKEETALEHNEDGEAYESTHEDVLDPQNEDGEQIETHHEETHSDHEASQETTEDSGTDRNQAEKVREEISDDHLNGGHDVVRPAADVKDEDETSGDVETNDENVDTDIISQEVQDEKVEDSMVDEQETGDKQDDDNNNNSREAGGNDASTDSETAEQEKGEDKPSVSEEANDKESVKGDSSEPDVTDDDVTDGETSVVEESDMEESERENSVKVQGSTTCSGLCPPETEDGDIICILHGCSVPVVLREMPDKGHMILIGEAYVHGKMDGEAMEDIAEDDSEIFYIH